MEEGNTKQSREDLEPCFRQTKKIAWITIGYLLFDSAIIFIAMQNSLAMKASWFQDLLFFIPPLSFLIGSFFISKPPNRMFRFGYDRTYSIGFLASSFALIGVGGFILIKSLLQLFKKEIVTIGTFQLFGETIWFGWVMIGVVGYSMIPTYLLGRRKLKLAKKLNIQILHADAKAQKADWLSSSATIVGIIGIGFGWWWADAVAAIIIACDILVDGVENMKAAVAEAMDQTPLNVELKEDPLIEEIEEVVMGEDWVDKFLVKLRKAGNKVTGEVLVVPKAKADLLDQSAQLTQKIKELHWEITEIAVAPVKELPFLYDKKI